MLDGNYCVLSGVLRVQGCTLLLSIDEGVLLLGENIVVFLSVLVVRNMVNCVIVRSKTHALSLSMSSNFPIQVYYEKNCRISKMTITIMLLKLFS